jgi:hypothetical protein
MLCRLHPNRRRSVARRDQPEEVEVASSKDIREHMEVIGADGVHIGTVDDVEEHRIKLTKKDSGQGSHRGHHHYVPMALVAEVEGDKVRLSANSDVAVTFEEEGDGSGA